ncbi:MAG: helix-turn-helix domain-containing protein [Pseudonocardiaceae bacterium]
MPPTNHSIIRKTRVARGWKVSELARRADVRPGHLANVESGCVNASIEFLNKVANVLDLPVAALLARDKSGAK